MNRRNTLLGFTALGAIPAALRAQPANRVHRVGLVSASAPGATDQAFRRGLRELGLVEGRNIVIEARFAEGRPERFSGLIDEVLRQKVDVLVIGTALGALAAKAATRTVPIVFTGLIDPVAPGIVTSLARPEGNITGVTFGIGGAEFGGKWIDLLKAAVPGITHMAVLWNSTSPSVAPLLPGMRAAARTLGVKIDLLDAGNPAMLEKAFAAIRSGGARGLIVTNDPFFYVNRNQLVEFAANRRLPALYFTSAFADAGGFMTYGSSLEDSYLRAATYVSKILKGARPSELPVEQPTQFELVINLKTAKSLGVKVPMTVLTRADRVIE